MINELPELNELRGNSDDVVEQVEIRVKYEGYIEKEQAMADKMSGFEGFLFHRILISQNLHL